MRVTNHSNSNIKFNKDKKKGTFVPGDQYILFVASWHLYIQCNYS